MKKFLIALGIVVALILAVAFVAPKEFRIEREITINQNNVAVFNYLKIMKNSNEWSPWEKKDPKMTQELKGDDGTVGAILSWSGNSEVGVGEQEIKNITPGKEIDFELRFQKPMQAVNQAYYIIEPLDDKQTKVIWGMTGSTPFPANIVCFFMQKKVGEEFAKGLTDLKGILEAQEEVSADVAAKKEVQKEEVKEEIIQIKK